MRIWGSVAQPAAHLSPQHRDWEAGRPGEQLPAPGSSSTVAASAKETRAGISQIPRDVEEDKLFSPGRKDSPDLGI